MIDLIIGGLEPGRRASEVDGPGGGKAFEVARVKLCGGSIVRDVADMWTPRRWNPHGAFRDAKGRVLGPSALSQALGLRKRGMRRSRSVARPCVAGPC